MSILNGETELMWNFDGGGGSGIYRGLKNSDNILLKLIELITISFVLFKYS